MITCILRKLVAVHHFHIYLRCVNYTGLELWVWINIDKLGVSHHFAVGLLLEMLYFIILKAWIANCACITALSDHWPLFTAYQWSATTSCHGNCNITRPCVYQHQAYVSFITCSELMILYVFIAFLLIQFVY